MLKKFPRIPVYTKHIPFKGGLDTETPSFEAVTGRVKASQNVYQGINGGYHTLQGYEAYNGLPAPSSAIYVILPCLVSNVSVGDTVHDLDSEAYGEVAGVVDDALILVDVTGAFKIYVVGDGQYIFDDTDELTDGTQFIVDGPASDKGKLFVSGVLVGVCTGAQSIGGAESVELDAMYTNMAADVYRDRISAVPGSGDVLGVCFYNDKWYAFRNTADGTAEKMYVNNATTGWTEVELGYELAFTSGGTVVPIVGNTITGATSGATAVLTAVVLEDGTFAGGDASGKFIFAEQTGEFEAENLNIGAETDVATIAADSSAIEFSVPDGRFEFDVTNFTGSATTKRMYGVDGKNRGFEFDGTTLVPISTGMTTDAPSHVVEHAYSLFYSFGASVQSSAVGFPYEWSPVVGSDEIGMGDPVTGFVPQIGSSTGNTLCIFTRNSFGFLYGSSVDDRVLTHQRKTNAGAIEWSSQLIGNTFSFDDRGITKLSTTDFYGNFNDATVSQNIQSWLTTKKTQVTASCIIREYNQYWIFFADMSALCCTVDNGEIVSFMPIQLSHKVTCVCSTEDESGNEIVMLGCSDGYVRQMNSGTSFDGEEIEWYFELVWDSLGSNTTKKKFVKWTMETAGDGYSKFYSSYDLSYQDSYIMQAPLKEETLTFSVGHWDDGTWDVGEWDGVSLKPSYFKMYGTGENISLKLSGSSDYCSQLKMSGALLQFKITREMR